MTTETGNRKPIFDDEYCCWEISAGSHTGRTYRGISSIDAAIQHAQSIGMSLLAGMFPPSAIRVRDSEDVIRDIRVTARLVPRFYGEIIQPPPFGSEFGEP